MKKKLMILFMVCILLFFSSYCCGLIKVNENLNQKYNLGDTIITSGYLLFDNDIEASFKIKLKCQDNEMLLMIKRYDLKANRKLNFDEWLVIPSSFENKCKLKYEVIQDDKVIEEVESKEFEIVKDLKVKISTDKKQIQLGESFLLNGTITNLNNEKINGNALISIRREDENYLIVNSDIENGKLNKKIGPIFIPNGEYALVIDIRDIYGNEQKIEDINFIVLTEIKPDMKLNKQEFLPWEKIRITGKIENLENISKEFDLKIKLNNYEEETTISNEFEYEFTIPENIKSYENNLIIEVSDKYGNKGSYEYIINIKPIIKKLILKTDKEEYNPLDIMLINITLIDQANDIINDDAELIIKKGFFKLFDEVVDSENLVKYNIEEKLTGENIKLIVKYNDLISEKEIRILELAQKNKESFVEKGLNYITGDFVHEIKESLNRLKYLIIALIIIISLILIFSHRTLRKEFRQIFSKKYGEAEDKIKKDEKLNLELKKRIDQKHKEKHEIKRVAQKYIERDILVSALKKEIPKQGIKKNITVLFADIREYTKFAENARDEELLKMLKIFFEKVSDSVYRYNGSINQIIGDEVFAIFNVIKEDKNHALNAIKAALEIRKNLRNLNEKLIKNKKRAIKIGIGINTGDALITNLGSKKKIKYTAIGNVVNIASRLENQASANQILITKNALEIIANDILVKDLGLFRLKNISNPVNVYDVIGLK